MTGDTTTDPVSASLKERAAVELDRQLAHPLEPGLYVVSTPIGNLADTTLRALATLARADLVCCEDTRHSRVLLSHFGIARPLQAYHEHNAAAERPRLLAALAEGKSVALISDAGTPLISDPGYKLVREAAQQGHRVIAVPGASAVLASLAIAGLPTDAFLFAGFLPARETARRARLAELDSLAATLVLFESPGRLAKTLAGIAENMPGREIAVARELTKRFEEVRRGTAADLAGWAAAAGDIKGEIVILIAPAPPAAEATEEEIVARLDRALKSSSLRDAARIVADELHTPRSRVYDIGLRLKAQSQ